MYRITLHFLICFLLASTFLYSQKSSEDCDCPGKVKKGTFYLSWGYNQAWFSKSTIRFTNTTTDNYDFTLHNVKAHDRPVYDLFNRPLTVPQYVYRMGYYFGKKPKWGLEINFDHVKYYVAHWQTARASGQIRGRSFNNDTILDPNNFIEFEHSDGANYLLLNVLRKEPLVGKKNKLYAVAKVGVGLVVPKTRVSILGNTIDNRFHVAGYVTGIDLGLRFEFLKYGFIETSAKGCFAHYLNSLVYDTGSKATHHFFSIEVLASAGIQIPVKLLY